MAGYDKHYQQLKFVRETTWPRGFESGTIDGKWITYFNVKGIIFYYDTSDFDDDLREIVDEASAFRVLRQLVKKNITTAIDSARKLIVGANTADKGQRIQTQTAIAVELGVMGGVVP